MEEVFGVDESELLLRHGSHALELEFQVVPVQVALVVFSVRALRKVGTAQNVKTIKKRQELNKTPDKEKHTPLAYFVDN